MLPVRMEAGSICNTLSQVVVDTLLELTMIRHYFEVDVKNGQWHMFRASIDQQPPAAPARAPKKPHVSGADLATS